MFTNPFGRVILLLASMIGVTAQAQQTASSQPAPAPTTQPQSTQPATTQPAMPSLIEKLPVYTGDWLSRSYLTGDWGGTRTQMADRGILFQVDLTQWFQGNAYGGKDTENATRFSGSADYYLKFDTARMGLWPGGLITLHGETQFGQSIIGKTGSLMVPNYQALLPLPGEAGLTTLSEFYIAQALSEKIVILAGKIDLTMGDANEFAHDQRTQFSNAAFRVNPVLYNAGPYTAMSAGVILIPTDWLTVVTFVNDNDPNGAATTTGFQTAFDGRNWFSVAQEYDFTLKLFGQTGHQRLGWYWTARDFRDLTSDPRIQLPIGVVGRGILARRFLPPWARVLRVGDTVYNVVNPEQRPDDWALYYNFDQYLFTESKDPKQGWGLFGRVGWSTGDANVIQQFYSGGLGGKGSIPSRDRDAWGVGYYFLNISDNLGSLTGIDSEQGVELFYNIEVTPWLHITPDLQFIVDPGGGLGDRDTAIVYGVRAQMSF